MKQLCRWHIYPTADDVYAHAAAAIARIANRHIEETGQFRIVLTGGTTARQVYRKLRGIDTDWPAWRIYWGDERCVAPDHPERNSRMAFGEWLDHIPLSTAQVFPIPAELGAEEGARRYDELVREVEEFDLVLLGLGEDGHVASLFPGQEWGMSPRGPAALPVHGSPKPPPERVSLSAWRLSLAQQAMFMLTGEGKRGAVSAWRSGEKIPATAIVPTGGVDVLLERACFVEA
ncbi:MAG: 6-phosphogluconolactonase [Sulfuricellaceae bacterium]